MSFSYVNLPTTVLKTQKKVRFCVNKHRTGTAVLLELNASLITYIFNVSSCRTSYSLIIFL